MTELSEKISIDILGNRYETSITIGKMIDFAKNKSFYSGGQYSKIQDGLALDMIDVISAMFAFFPEVLEKRNISSLLDLTPKETKSLLDEFGKKFFPWFADWRKEMQNINKVEKEEDGE